jgi:hypothetical protein
MLIVRGIIAGIIVVAVSLIANRQPRLGAFLLTLPIVSILAFAMTWHQKHDLQAVSRLAKETLVLVPLGLPFFVPLAFADKLRLGYWTAFGAGVVLASITIGLWFWFGPKTW